jgi:site-specific DNA-cytosine methylase
LDHKILIIENVPNQIAGMPAIWKIIAGKLTQGAYPIFRYDCAAHVQQ